MNTPNMYDLSQNTFEVCGAELCDSLVIQLRRDGYSAYAEKNGAKSMLHTNASFVAVSLGHGTPRNWCLK